jgi:hypothetical protein
VIVYEFTKYAKTPRLYRDIMITEKIDGTNAAIAIVRAESPSAGGDPYVLGELVGEADHALVYAQSRKRVIVPGADNYGFASWVAANAAGLVEALGYGIHFGEWWGQGIQRKYDQQAKMFSLFNVTRYSYLAVHVDASDVPGLRVVPKLYEGVFSQAAIDGCVDHLRTEGSAAAPGFMRAEGVIVRHQAAGQVFKVLLENDELPKGRVR